MAFTVKFSNETTTPYPENVKFKIQDNGVLVVSSESSRVHFAPHAWISVEQDVDPDRVRSASM